MKLWQKLSKQIRLKLLNDKWYGAKVNVEDCINTRKYGNLPEKYVCIVKDFVIVSYKPHTQKKKK